MSAIQTTVPGEAALSQRRAGLLVILLGMTALAVRPVSTVAGFVPVLVGAAALAVPVSAGRRSGAWIWLLAVLVGVAAVTVATPPGAVPSLTISPATLVATLGAAVGEEILFRRLAFAHLLRWGAVVAVVGSAVAFAAVHLPAYGPMALWANLGAGILFGWQRWLTGGWSAPAVTHGAANLLAAGWPL
jgi:uncharacterized protein